MKETAKIEIALAGNVDREQIYKLSHDVYGSELKQHNSNKEKSYQDEIDDFNIYIIAKIDDEIAGFISVTPPIKNKYSIDKYFIRREIPFKVDNKTFEVRILTVLKAFRGRAIALVLIYAAFRYIETSGGASIMAIGRLEVLNMYLKLGFKNTNMQIVSGAVKYELIYGKVNDFKSIAENNYKNLFTKLKVQCDWKLAIDFFKPTDCYHGGAFFEAIGNEFQDLNRRKKIINADVLDAWFDPSPKVVSELKKHLSWICKTSPPTDCQGMAKGIAKARKVNQENILPGSGSSDLIFLAFREWLTDQSKVLILDPTYGEYAHVLINIIGCKVDRINLSKDNDYELNVDELVELSKNNYDLIVIVNPNSPTGQHTPRKILESALDQIPIITRIWIDETYVEYTGNNQSLEKFAVERKNIIVCKSMSKVYALSGLRCAYLCASSYQLEKLISISPPWAVSLTAQIAALIVLQESDYYEKYYKQTHILREELTNELLRLNIKEVLAGKANFVLCYLHEDGPNAKDVTTKCKEKGLYIRDISNMGNCFNKHTIRIAIKDRVTNQKMLKVLNTVLKN